MSISIPAPLSGWASVRYLEKDNSSFVTAESSLRFGSVFAAENGPVLDIIGLSDKTTLAGLYGEPTDTNRVEWYNIANVFKYKSGVIGGTGRLCRVVGTGSLNQALAVTDTKVVDSAELTTQLIKNEDDAVSPTVTFDAADDASDTRIKFFSKYPTEFGYKIALSTATDFATALVITGVSFVDTFDVAPTGTEVAICILNPDDEIIEAKIVDLTDGNVDDEGVNNFIEVAINETSSYILAYLNATNTSEPVSFQATDMLKGNNVAPVKADYLEGLELYEDIESVDINYMIPHSANTVKETDTLCKNRQDCQMIWSAPISVVVGKDAVTATSDLVTYATTTENFTSDYAEFFGNAGMFYDEYSRKNIWGELAGDILGLRILKNLTGNPWEASAGLDDGQLRNIVKLAINFKPTQQITLQKNKINPIVNKSGKGIFSWGVQNYTTKKSALIDSTTRGLLVTIWRAMRDTLEFDLFKINDDITQGQIRAKTELFMEQIEANRGVSNINGLPAFRVICDDSNNTAQIVDAGQLVVEIRLVPSRIAKEIILIANIQRTGSTLEEVI